MPKIYNLTDNWNDGTTVFDAIKINVTDTASDATSKLLDLQIGGTSKFKVDKGGNVTLDGSITGLDQVDNTSDLDKPVSTLQATAIGVVQTDVDNHEALTNNPHTVTAAQVGLGNVDNTSDLDKPISTLTQAAIDAAGGGAFDADANTLITASTPIVLDQAMGDEAALTLDYTTNKAAGNDTGLLINQTDTLSPGTSKLLDLQVGGVSLLQASAAGGATVFGGTALNSAELAIESRAYNDNCYLNFASSSGRTSALSSINGRMRMFVNDSGGGPSRELVNFVAGSGGAGRTLLLNSELELGWRDTVGDSWSAVGSADLKLVRDAANTLGQRNGVNAQTFNIYNTYTNATNYERGHIGWNDTADTFVIGTEAGSGGGATRGLQLKVGTARVFEFDTALRNSSVGEGSLASASLSGPYNTASGYRSLYNNTSGGSNVATGSNNLYSNTTGNSNVASGVESLYSNTTGSNNTASGYQAGRYQSGGTTGLTTASNSVFLGATTKGIQGATNQIVIGDTAESIGANSVVLGNDSIVTTALKGNVGITSTWNDAADTFTLIKADVTDTASAAGSKLLDLQVGGVSQVSIDAGGVFRGNQATTASTDSSVGAYALKFTSDANGSEEDIRIWKGRMLFPVRSPLIPAINFGDPGGAESSGYGGDGLGRPIGNGYTGVWAQNSCRFWVSATIAGMSGNIALGWASSTLASSNLDLTLLRDAANTLAQRNGVNAQTFNIYNTYTDASNYERGHIGWNADRFVIGNTSAGTGANRYTQLGSGVNGSILLLDYVDNTGMIFAQGGSDKFYMRPSSLNSSHSVFYDLGDPGTSRWGVAYTQALDVDQGTLTDDAQALNITSTWNDAADTFTLIKADVTDTASAAGSKLLDLQVGGVSKLSVSKGGDVSVSGSIAATGTIKATPTTVGALPAAATAGAGARTFVTDSANSLSSHHGQTVTGGGTDFSPVYSDGTTWRVG